MVGTTVRSEIESLLAAMDATDDEATEARRWVSTLAMYTDRPEGSPTTPPEIIRMGWR